MSRKIDSDTFPDVRGNTIDADTGEIKGFVRYYLMAPVGPKLLRFGPDGDVNRRRLMTINQSLQAWREMNGARDKKGRLKVSMRCVGYAKPDAVSDNWRCGKKTKDPAGVCSLHSGPDSRTLWTYEPFSEIDDRTDILCHSADALIQRSRKLTGNDD